MTTDKNTLPIETLLNSEYHILRQIGKGGFSITYLAESLSNGSIVVVKELFNNEYMDRTPGESQVYIKRDSYLQHFEKDRSRFINEWDILQRFKNSPGSVHPIEFFEENGTVYIIMEHLSGGSIKDIVHSKGAFSANDLLVMSKSVISLLSEMHEQGYIHGDISPDNLVLAEDGNIKLIDFGSVMQTESPEKTTEFIRKEGYTAVEVYPKNAIADPRMDIYSFCATLYYSLTGVSPEDSVERLLEDNLAPLVKINSKIDPLIDTLVMKGLSLEPKNRWNSIEEMENIIFQYFNSQNKKMNTSEDDKRKKTSKNIIILISFVAITSIAFFFFVRKQKEETTFIGSETQKIVFYYNKDMNLEDIETLRSNIEDKTRHMSGNKYYLKQNDGYFEATVRYDASIDLPTLLNKFFNYNYCLLEADQNDAYIELSKIDMDNIDSIEERPDGLALVLSKELQKKISESTINDTQYLLNICTGGNGSHIWDTKNTPLDGEYYDIEVNYDNTNGVLYISNNALGGEIARTLFIDCLSQKNIPIDSFNYSRHIIWEKKQDTTWGNYQVNPSQLHGETVLLGYLNEYYTENDYNILNIQVFEDEVEENMDVIWLKKRLDALKIPFACGYDESNEYEIYIKVEQDSIWEIEAAMLFEYFSNDSFNYSKDDLSICIKSSSGILFPNVDMNHHLSYEDEKVSVKIKNVNSTSELIKKTMGDYIQLCLNGRPLFQTASPKLSEDGWLSFETLLLDNIGNADTDRNRHFIDFLNTILDEGPLEVEYTFQGALFIDKHGLPIWDKSLWNLPGCEQTSMRNEIEQYFSDTGFLVDWYLDYPSYVTITGDFNDVLSKRYSHPYAIVGEFLHNFSLNNEIQVINFTIKAPKYDIQEDSIYAYYIMDISKNNITGTPELSWSVYPGSNNYFDLKDSNEFILSSIEKTQDYLGSESLFNGFFLFPAIFNKDETIIINNEKMLLKAIIKKTSPGQNYQIAFDIENKSSEIITIYINQIGFNNVVSNNPNNRIDFKANYIGDYILEFPAEDLHFSPLNPIKNVFMELTIKCNNKEEKLSVILPDKSNLKNSLKDALIPETAVLIEETPEYDIYSLGFGQSYFLPFKDSIRLLLVNKTEKHLSFNFKEMHINIFQADLEESSTSPILPDTLFYYDLYYSFLDNEAFEDVSTYNASITYDVIDEDASFEITSDSEITIPYLQSF